MFIPCSEFLKIFFAFLLLVYISICEMEKNNFRAMNQVKIVDNVVVPYKDTFFKSLHVTDHCVSPFRFKFKNPTYSAKVKPVELEPVVFVDDKSKKMI